MRNTNLKQSRLLDLTFLILASILIYIVNSQCYQSSYPLSKISIFIWQDKCFYYVHDAKQNKY